MSSPLLSRSVGDTEYYQGDACDVPEGRDLAQHDGADDGGEHLGMALFVITSAACALAPDPAVLVAAAR